MPVLDILLVHLVAQEDFPAVAGGIEINQPFVEVLHDDPHVQDFLEKTVEVKRELVEALAHPRIAHQVLVQPHQSFQDGIYRRYDLLRLFQSEISLLHIPSHSTLIFISFYSEAALPASLPAARPPGCGPTGTHGDPRISYTLRMQGARA